MIHLHEISQVERFNKGLATRREAAPFSVHQALCVARRFRRQPCARWQQYHAQWLEQAAQRRAYAAQLSAELYAIARADQEAGRRLHCHLTNQPLADWEQELLEIGQ